MSIEIEVDTSVIIDRLSKVDISRMVREKLDKGGEKILADAKQKVHVVSGNLRDSGRTQMHGDSEVQISFHTSYARLEEDRVGGKYPGPHAYLEPSVDANIPQIVKNVKEGLIEELK
jgi:hypothetical protein